jgi:hypothetical protein
MSTKRILIVEKIRNTLVKLQNSGLEWDREKLIYEICLENGCSRRTAIDYIRTAEVGMITAYG